MNMWAQGVDGGWELVNIEIPQKCDLKTLLLTANIRVAKIYSLAVRRDRSLGSSMMNFRRRKL